MKLLVVTPAHLQGYKIGGPIASTMAMLRGLAEHAVKIDILSTPMGAVDESCVTLNKWENCEFPGGRAMYFPYYGYRHFTFSPSLAWNLIRLARNYDIIVLNGTWNFPILAGGFIAIRLKIPFVVWPHGTLYKFTIHQKSRWLKSLVYWIALRRIITNAAAVHFTTTHEIQGFKSYFGYLPQHFLQPNGFDLDAFKQLPQKGSFALRFPEVIGKRQVLFFGRITRKKGLDILVESFSSILPEFNDAHLVVAGLVDDADFFEELKERIASLGITDRVTFTGLLTGEARFWPLVDAEVFVLPSYSENFGMSVVEAMLCGVPVIVSTEVGVAAEIQAAGAGIVVPPTVAATKNALREMLIEPALRDRYRRAGIAHARQTYSFLTVGSRLFDFYEEILARRTRK
jgi:glycosyltransferase involved in cell wall biosynthesis